MRRPCNPIGIGWAGPDAVHAGTEEQKERYLLPLLAGEEIWCQLFSEPGAGSDLATSAPAPCATATSTSSTARRSGRRWPSSPQFGILIARTDPDVPKHKGISYFICPMDAPGIEIRPIIEMTGAHTFNEVFFTDVRIPAENLVGDENDGWSLAKVTLGNERVSLSGGGALWGIGPDRGRPARPRARTAAASTDPLLRQRLAAALHRVGVLRLIRLRTVTRRASRASSPGPRRRSARCWPTSTASTIMGLAKDLAGPAAMLRRRRARSARRPDVLALRLPVRPALTIGGGTGEVQRNIIAERVLGLPHDIDVEQGRTWSESRRVPAPG